MSVNQLLWWEKYRPKTLDEAVLPERIKKHFENGVNGNYIFYGNYGTGKTSLARILIGTYTKDKAYYTNNTSMNTSVNVLRDEIQKFCKTVPMMATEDDMKYVFLDEFERASAEYQDALKAFSEHYNQKVRFIFVTNHINKIEDGIKSRFTALNFNPQSAEEVREIKIGMAKRMKYIAEQEGYDIPKEELITIINKNFPDNREMTKEMETIYRVGDQTTKKKVDQQLKMKTYELIYDKGADYPTIYNFVMENYGAERIDQLFDILGRDFINKSIADRQDVDKLFECNNIISDYRDKLESKTDPLVLGMSVIGKYRDILI